MLLQVWEGNWELANRDKFDNIYQLITLYLISKSGPIVRNLSCLDCCIHDGDQEVEQDDDDEQEVSRVQRVPD